MSDVGLQLLAASKEIMRLNARVRQLEDAIIKHKENNPSIDHGLYWWRRDTELYRILEAK